MNGANRFASRDVNFFATGATDDDAIGAETTNSSAYLELKTSSLFGTKADISQTAGTIFIAHGTDMINNNANGYGFDTSYRANNIQFGAVGDFRVSGGGLATNQVYLMPGTLPTQSLLSNINYIPFYKTTQVYGATFIETIPFTGTNHVNVKVFKYNSSLTTSTQIYTTMLNASTNLIFIDSVSSFRFTQGESLAVMISSAVTANTENGILAKFDLY